MEWFEILQGGDIKKMKPEKLKTKAMVFAICAVIMAVSVLTAVPGKLVTTPTPKPTEVIHTPSPTATPTPTPLPTATPAPTVAPAPIKEFPLIPIVVILTIVVAAILLSLAYAAQRKK